MRFVHTADIHIGLKNHDRVDPVTRQSSRVEDVFKCIDYMIDYIEREKIEYLFIAGDVFHTKVPAISEQVKFSQRLERLNSLQVSTHILLGNHDVSEMLYRHAALHIPAQLQLPFVHVYREFGEYHGENFSALFIGPYVKEQVARERITLFLEQVSKDSHKTFLFCHPLMDGSEYSTGVEAETIEESWSPNLFKQFPKLDYIGMGHVHKHQVITKKPLSLYCGSLSRCDFGEVEDKGFIVVDTEPQLTWRLELTPTRDFQKFSGTQDELLAILNPKVEDKLVKLCVSLKTGEVLDSRSLRSHYKNSFNVVIESERVQTDLAVANQDYKKTNKIESTLAIYFETDPDHDKIVKLAKDLKIV